MRISWEEYALRLAQVAALRSEDKWTKAGACALAHNNMVLGVAYNGLASGKKVDTTFWEDREGRLPFMLHAEINLLSLFNRGEARLIATNFMPCSNCAAAICAWGIKKVVYGGEYHRDNKAVEIFRFYDVELQELKLS